MKVIVFREPASTVVGPDAFGAPASVGTGIKYAREDHDHGLPANPAPAPATTVTGPDNYGDAAVVGTGVKYAREDHNHGLPAAPSSTLNNHAGHLAADSSSFPTTILTTASLAIGTWEVKGTVTISAPAACQASIVLAVGTATATFEGAISATAAFTQSDFQTITFSAIVTVSVAGTLTISGKTSASAPIASHLDQAGDVQATGYTAIQIG